MKRIAFLLILSLVSTAQAIELDAIKQIESGGNPYAYNAKTKAIGLYQITPICLADFNIQNKLNVASSELYDPEINKLVASWYFIRIDELLKRYQLDLTDENRLIAYNFGIGNLIKYRKGKIELPEETKNYLARYKTAKERD